MAIKTKPHIICLQETFREKHSDLTDVNKFLNYKLISHNPATLGKEQQRLQQTGQKYGRASGGLAVYVRNDIRKSNNIEVTNFKHFQFIEIQNGTKGQIMHLYNCYANGKNNITIWNEINSI